MRTAKILISAIPNMPGVKINGRPYSTERARTKARQLVQNGNASHVGPIWCFGLLVADEYQLQVQGDK